MTSVSGRISSATMLRIAQRRKTEMFKSQKTFKRDSNVEVKPSVEETKTVATTETVDNDEPLKVLTPNILERLNAEQKIRLEKLNTQLNSKNEINSRKEKLIDGEIVYDDVRTSEDDPALAEILFKGKDYTLDESNVFPARYGKIKKNLLHKPLVELDPYICLLEQTFIIISKRFTKYYIQRYSSKNSLFIFSPFNKLRQACLFLSTWQFFDLFMILTILINCVIMAIPLSNSQSDITDIIRLARSYFGMYVFVAIYTVEVLVKVCARGFILDKYSYLRDPWNWLDFVIVIISYVTIIVSLTSTSNSINLSALRAFRVFRAFKTINIITGLKTIVNAILKSLSMLIEVIILMGLMIIIFSVLTLQVYRGSFSQKCVLKHQSNSNLLYNDWINSESNWLYDNDNNEYILCSNGTGSNAGRACDDGYVCLKNVGQNPSNGLLSFDNFGWCLLVNFQLFNLDHFEDVYNKIIDSNGAWNFIFFLPIVFIGSYYLINLLLAVVVLAYEQEATSAKKKLESPPQKKAALVYDIDSLKQKIALKAKEIEEKKKKKQEKSTNVKVNTEQNAEIIDSKNDRKSSLDDIKVGLSEFKIANNEDENPNITTIELSQKMGKFNIVVQEGSGATNFTGQDLLSDDRNYVCCLKFGQHFLNWINFQNKVRKIVTSLYFELLIMLCIIINTIVMAIQYNGEPQIIADLEDYFNYIIFSVFLVECVMKIIAFGRLYFMLAGNWFDLAIIILSVIDFALPQVDGLSIFRTFRLLGIFKLAKTWKTMKRILSIVLNTVSALGYLSIILLLIVYIFSVVGNDLLQDSYLKYYSKDEMPRSNFTDIIHSLLAIFRILCGEYTEPLAECWVAAGPICTAVFFPTIFFGNYIVLNLYLALLLDAFDADSFQKEEEDDEFQKQLKELINSIKKFINKIKSRLRSNENTISPETFNAAADDYNSIDKEEELKEMNENKNNHNNTLKVNLDKEWKKKFRKKSVIFHLEDCLPVFCYKKICKCANEDNRLQNLWSKFRLICLRISENKIFEVFIIAVIITSSVCLAFDDVYLKNDSYESIVLSDLNYAFQVVFILEMLIKWAGYGLRQYFTDWWCLLDFIVVVVGILDLYFSLSGGTNIGFLKVLRTFRGLRPLRAISQWEAMRIVVNALANSIPAIFNVFVVCFMFWLIFSIMGVALFKGKFYKCVDSTTGNVLTNIKNKTDCLGTNGTMWYNSKINFDNIANGYLALFQIATFEGWQEIIQDAVDSIDIDIQPAREANQWVYLYFVAFVIFGAFFTLNLFIGVIIDNFNILKKQYEGAFLDVFLTPNQLAYYHTMKKICQNKPSKSIKRPNNKFQAFIYDMVQTKYFEIAIMITVSLNVAVLSIQYNGQTEYYEDILSIVNCAFATLYGIEVSLKLIGLRCQFFRNGWNTFDLLVILIALINEPLKIYSSKYLVEPTLLRVIRIFQVTRILYFLKAARGIRKLLIALIVSLPGLFNIITLSFLIIYIYSIIGMNLFMNVKLHNSLTPTMNFQTFFKSFMLLFRLSTAAGWNDILDSLMLSSTDPGSTCDDKYDLQSLPSSTDPRSANGCGNTGTAIVFMTTYVFIMRMVMMNMFVAIIFDNYNQTHKEEEIGITNEDIESFYKTWQKYDQHACQFIRLDQLSNFVAELGPPLGIEKPNEMAVTSFDLPIVKGDLIHCLDILHGLVKYALDNVEDNEDFNHLQKHMDKTFLYHFPIRIEYQPITTTIIRKKLEIAARTLQRAWKSYKLQKTLRDHIVQRKLTSSFSANTQDI